MLELDLSPEIAALRSTFRDIRAVVDVDALEAEIARLSEQAGRTRPVGRHRARPEGDERAQPPPVRARACERASTARLDDLEVLIELANEVGDEETAPPRRAPSSRRCRRRSATSRCRPCSTASGTTARPSSRSAPAPAASMPPTSPRCSCACTCAGPRSTTTRRPSWTRATPKRRASSRRPSRSTPPTPSAR